MEGVKQIVGKDSRYKLFWSGNDNATGGVGVLLAEEWWEKVFEVVRVSDRIILIRMTIGKTVFVFVCVYAPQANLSEFEKDRFYQMLQCTVAKIPASEQLFVCGDWNGHIGSQSTGFEEVHGGQAIGQRNTEGERVLEKYQTGCGSSVGSVSALQAVVLQSILASGTFFCGKSRKASCKLLVKEWA